MGLACPELVRVKDTVGVAVGGEGVSGEPICFLSIAIFPWHVEGRESRGQRAIFVRDRAMYAPGNCVISLG